MTALVDAAAVASNPCPARAPLPSSSRVVPGQLGEGARRDRYREHRVGHDEHGPREPVEHQRAAAAVAVGQHDHHGDRGVLRDQCGHPGQGSRLTRGPTPGGEPQRGPRAEPEPPGRDRPRSPPARARRAWSRRTAGTPRSAAARRACRRTPPPTAPNPAYAPITTSDDSSGARAGAPNRRCDCKIPYSTTASPYSSTCGAKTISIRAPTPASGRAGSRAAPESSAETTGCAASASTRADRNKQQHRPGQQRRRDLPGRRAGVAVRDARVAA